MSGVDYHPGDRIAALATPASRSALALIRLSGDGTIDTLAPLFSPSETLRKADSHSAHHGVMQNPRTGEIVDEVVLVVYRAPTSFTGEESAEIMPHGSIPGVRMLLELLFENGFREANPGEFTLRSFINGKIDLPQAEAVRELIEAKTRTAHLVAVNRLSGGTNELYGNLRRRLLDLIAPVELALDYPEEETGTPIDIHPFDTIAADALLRRIDEFLDRFRVGRIYRDGYRIVIAGATNAGKSSLFNLLLREERAIVSEVHGTTRDFIDSWISIREIPVRLFDTAGLREIDDEIESAGVRKTESLLADADCILYLVDASRGETAEDRDRIESLRPDRCLRLWSKCDLSETAPPDGYLTSSSIRGDGFRALEDAIFEKAGGFRDSQDATYLESDRQKRCLERFRAAVSRAVVVAAEGFALDAIAAELSDAVAVLGELTGEITSSEILESVFSKFCVGK